MSPLIMVFAAVNVRFESMRVGSPTWPVSVISPTVPAFRTSASVLSVGTVIASLKKMSAPFGFRLPLVVSIVNKVLSVN